MEKVNLEELSTSELEALLAKKKKEDAKRRQEMKAAYEAKRDELVTKACNEALKLHNQLKAFKEDATEAMEAFRELAQEYGDITKRSKGGFSLRTSDQEWVLVVERNTKPEYDERANIAEELLKQFLEEKVKRADVKTYRTILALMERNKKGDFSPSQIAALLKVRDNYDHPKWQRAMQLFEESYRNRVVSQSLAFYRKDQETGKDEHISLSFPSL